MGKALAFSGRQDAAEAHKALTGTKEHPGPIEMAEPKCGKVFIHVGVLSHNRVFNSSKGPSSADRLLELFLVTWRKQWSILRKQKLQAAIQTVE